jgi:hypothetical protein
MAENVEEQADAALSAAKARQAIAERVRELAPNAKTEAAAQTILYLAEAYAHLAAEPPRVRAT